jgi:hypothetical protein
VEKVASLIGTFRELCVDLNGSGFVLVLMSALEPLKFRRRVVETVPWNIAFSNCSLRLQRNFNARATFKLMLWYRM